MKIICISHWRFPAEKTMTPYMMRVAESFAKEGAVVEFWVPRRLNPGFAGVDPFGYHAIEKNFRIRRLPVIDLMGVIPGSISFFIMLLSFTAGLFLYVLKEPDKKNTIFYFFDLRDAWTTLFLSKNVFSEIHMYYKSSVDFINRWGFSHMRGLIIPTKAMMEPVRSGYQISSQKMIHAPCAVNSERFAIDISKEEARTTLGLPAEGCLILYVGHLFPVKGVDILFDAHTMLASGETIYFVGGTDEDIGRFKIKWENAGKPERVVIAGRRPHQEIPLWLRAADILSIPNTAQEDAGSIESSPSKQMEYMASGRPIIASDVPGIRDVMDDSMAYFVQPDSAEAIAQAVREIVANPAEAQAKGQKARTAAARDLSWDARAQKIIRFIKERMSV
ncbi:MAG: glycosyltransferase family 4 protein [Patescibacteria group bacterium]